MKRRKITEDEKTLFSQIEVLKSSGFWSDSISIDKLMIEANCCPGCQRSLIYQGWSNATEYRAFGICERCQFARLFWTETVQFSGFKKKICEAVKKAA